MIYQLMRWLVFIVPCLAWAQADDARLELTLSAWRTNIEGAVQSGGLPVALHGDLNLSDTWTFFSKLAFRPGRRHVINIEGSPYEFSGQNTLLRTIVYNGRTYSLNDTVASQASLAYLFGGYQFDLIARERGTLGIEAGGAYLNGEGTIRSVITGISATRNQIIGLPLAGVAFRAYAGPGHLNVNGEGKGMAFGGYGHFFQGMINLGAGFRALMFQAGYQYMNADIHENRGTNPAGISPVISGPIFSVQLRVF